MIGVDGSKVIIVVIDDSLNSSDYGSQLLITQFGCGTLLVVPSGARISQVLLFGRSIRLENDSTHAAGPLLVPAASFLARLFLLSRCPVRVGE